MGVCRRFGSRFHARAGVVPLEIGLLFLFLALAAGSSMFLVFLSSRDVQEAQARLRWEQEVERRLDEVVLEVRNAAQIEFPFQADGNQCVFRRHVADWAINPGADREGFLFADGALSYFAKTASDASQIRSFHGRSGPVLTGVKGVVFRRPHARLLRVLLSVTPPDDADHPVVFERNVYLANQ